jgi:hypothetical protein
MFNNQYSISNKQKKQNVISASPPSPLHGEGLGVRLKKPTLRGGWRGYSKKAKRNLRIPPLLCKERGWG